MPEIHSHTVRVYFEDTDAAGIVYYANYFKFAERARTEMMRWLGKDHAAMMAETGLAFAVRHCEADYMKSARLDELLTVETRLTSVKGATIEGEQRISRDGEDVVLVKVRLACIDGRGRPARMPDDVRAVLDDYCERCQRS